MGLQDDLEELSARELDARGLRRFDKNALDKKMGLGEQVLIHEAAKENGYVFRELVVCEINLSDSARHVLILV